MQINLKKKTKRRIEEKEKTKSFRIKNKFDIFQNFQKALNILKIDPEGEEVKKKKGHQFFSKGVDEGHVDVKNYEIIYPKDT